MENKSPGSWLLVAVLPLCPVLAVLYGLSTRNRWSCIALLLLEPTPVVSLAVPHLALVAPRGRATPSNYLAGKVVWVTGASSGLGEELAVSAAEAGARGVILSGRRDDALAAVRERCIAASPSKSEACVRVLGFDLSDLGELPSKARQALGEYGALDVLVLNAGVSTRSSVDRTSLDVDKTVMNVNYFSAITLAKAVLGHMLERRCGHLVVVNSVQGKFGMPFRSSYSASKHALQGFFDSLRAEVAGHGVKVTSIFPGYIRTRLSENALIGDGQKYSQTDATTAAGKHPRDVAGQVWTSVASGREDVVLADAKVKVAILLRTLMPATLFKIMAKRARTTANQ